MNPQAGRRSEASTAEQDSPSVREQFEAEDPSDLPSTSGLNRMQLDILWVLLLGEQSGSEIKAELSTYHPEGVTDSRVYYNLRKLADGPLVRIVDTDGHSDYRLTTGGRRALFRRELWIDSLKEAALMGL